VINLLKEATDSTDGYTLRIRLSTGQDIQVAVIKYADNAIHGHLFGTEIPVIVNTAYIVTVEIEY
jgi:hypothetical protein